MVTSSQTVSRYQYLVPSAGNKQPFQFGHPETHLCLDVDYCQKHLGMFQASTFLQPSHKEETVVEQVDCMQVVGIRYTLLILPSSSDRTDSSHCCFSPSGRMPDCSTKLHIYITIQHSYQKGSQYNKGVLSFTSSTIYDATVPTDCLPIHFEKHLIVSCSRERVK